MFARILAIALFAFVVGCSSYRVEGPGTYSHDGVIITPQQLEMRGSKLRLRFTFVNHTEHEIMVDRNQTQLVLPDGQVVGRFKGTFGGMTKGFHKIEAGMSHDVFMDFLLDGEPPEELLLQLTGVVADGKPMDLPDYKLTIEPE
ncbi:MAG: hypothetical protein HOW73_05520 [Polyangiaceae bacterium]|nr:hypothetical protein [Polyangiaceae bacterium]